MVEKTFIIIKPDSILRGLAGDILSRFEKKGLKLVAAKFTKPKRSQFDELYAHIKDRPFYPDYVKFMRKTPVLLVVLEGLSAVEIVRKMCGVTNSREAESFTIRGTFGMSGRMNLVHASDSPSNAEKEISIFFKPREIYDYKSPMTQLIYSGEEIQTMNTQAITPAGHPRKLPGKEDE